MDLEDLEHLSASAYFLFMIYREWQKEKRSQEKGQPAKQKPKSKKRSR